MAIWFLILSLIGFFDATYLTAQHFAGHLPGCSILEGCGTVLTSQYATVGGFIPVAVLGMLYYGTVFLLTINYRQTKREEIFVWVSRFTIIGFLASLWFVYLQLFVIKALCIYCMTSAVTSTILFILGMVFLARRKSIEE